MRDLYSLEGKIALVTGGSTGIGALIAEGFVTFGAKVYLVARREEVLEQKQDELRHIGPCEYIVADVASVAGIWPSASIAVTRPSAASYRATSSQAELANSQRTTAMAHRGLIQ